MAHMKAEKPDVMKRQMALLQQRYDLRNDPLPSVTMSGGKAIQQGVRAKLKKEMSWEKLAGMTPAEILERDVFPDGFLALPHPNHPEGCMVFPKFHIDELKKQEARDLIRHDLELDLPDHFLPGSPPRFF
jgi:cytochrome c peroxidase